MKILGKNAIIEQFLIDGIHYMFGNPGTSEEGFLDVIKDYPDFEYILGLHESVAVGIADGYARKTGKPAVIQLHSGVGLGNGIGMLYQAYRGHAPLVVIAGTSGVKYEAMDAQMAVDLAEMAKPVTKWAYNLHDKSSLLRVLRRAIKIAMTPPTGPVFISLPMDILDQEIDEEIIPTTFLNTNTYPDDETIDSIFNLMGNANKPLFIIGDGISASKAQEELNNFANFLGAEVWGADCSEVNIKTTDSLYMGNLGHMFGEVSHNIIKDADVILICGSYIFPEVFPRLNNAISKGTKIVHIDKNTYEIAKNFPVDVGLVADPKMTLKKLYDLFENKMTEEQKNKAKERKNEILTRKQKSQEEAIAEDNLLDKNKLHPSHFASILAKHLPKDKIIFDESLTSYPGLIKYIKSDEVGSYFASRGGSLGLSVPGAIGIKLAVKDKTVIGFSGDGGSLYTIQALWSAAHYKINAKFVIFNNHSYKLLKSNIDEYWEESQIPSHEYPESFDLTNPNIRFDLLSQSLGVAAVRVETYEEIEPAIKKMLETDEPFLIEYVMNE
jgi:benzoylformate decarboxylase